MHFGSVPRRGRRQERILGQSAGEDKGVRGMWKDWGVNDYPACAPTRWGGRSIIIHNLSVALTLPP